VVTDNLVKLIVEQIYIALKVECESEALPGSESCIGGTKQRDL